MIYANACYRYGRNMRAVALGALIAGLVFAGPLYAAGYAMATGTAVDIDGNIYASVTIGKQIWMHENINTTHAANGDSIARYCYDDVEANCDTFGGLYTWYDVMAGSAEECAQGICPDGWHMPSDDEWKTLEMSLGMSQQEADKGDEYPWRGTDQGTQLSVDGTSGFDFLEAGRRHDDGMYAFKNQVAYFWTSTPGADTAYAWRRCLANDDPGVGRWSTFPKTWGFSVRCLKNDSSTAAIGHRTMRSRVSARMHVLDDGSAGLIMRDIRGRQIGWTAALKNETELARKAVSASLLRVPPGVYLVDIRARDRQFTMPIVSIEQ